MAGLIHIYCGDGKGKTTAAVGLTVRAAGAGKRVVFAQFFKDGTSSELAVLRQLDRVQIMHAPRLGKRFARMTPKEREQAKEACGLFWPQVLRAAEEAELLVLDEVLSACRRDLLSYEALLRFLEEKGEELEVVLTGREPSEPLLERADYVTRMEKIKHPFDRGIPAREGIEW